MNTMVTKKLKVWGCLWMALTLCGVQAASPAASPAPNHPVWPASPPLAARAWLLLDISTHQILAAKDADTVVEPASLTKLMTAYLVFKALDEKRLTLQQTLPVSERAWRMTGSRMFIDPKMNPTVEQLLLGMIVQSGNDATVALAEGVGGTVEQFVQMMNQQAQAFGLRATQFKNPEGLTEPGHSTTVRDLSEIATRLMRDFPQYTPMYATKAFTFNGIQQPNRNLLLYRDPSVDGLKTGHTDAAGFCLIASAQRDFPHPAGAAEKHRLLSVVVGTASEQARATESHKLLNWGYSSFDWVRLYSARQTVLESRVWKGELSQVSLGREQPIWVAVPVGESAQIKTVVDHPDPLLAPLQKGQNLGTLRVSVGRLEVARVPLQALQPVPAAGWAGRSWDQLRLWIKR
jgi:D-alanyl-D-alanine carboxypeptidase (penicillin-binding protein 5/6)